MSVDGPAPSRGSVLIAGCGDLGTETGLRFEKLGYRVQAVRRRAELLPGSFDVQALDLRHERPVVAPDTVAVVVALTAGERTAEAYRASYLDGLAHVLDAVEGIEPAPRILLVSSTAVYDVDDGSDVDESTPAVPPTPTAEVLLDTERLLLSRAADAVVLRLGGVYGPGRERLIDQVRDGDARIPPNAPHTNRIHRDDAAAALVHLALLDAPPPLVLGVDDEPARLGDVLRFIAFELGRPAPPEAGDALRGAGDKRCRNGLLRSTAFEYAYPTYRDGYGAVLRGEGARHP